MNSNKQRVTRRDILSNAIFGGIIASAGCSLPANPFSGGSLPQLNTAWLEITDNGDGKLVLEFNGDIQSAISNAPISKEDLISAVKNKGLEAEFTPVSINSRSIIDDDASTNSNQLLQAYITGFSDLSDVAGKPRFATHAVTYEESLNQSNPDTPTPEECAQYETPASLPGSPVAPFHVIFPDGDHYVLPRDFETANGASPFVDYVNGNPFNYDGESPKRTFPFMIHYSHPKLVAMRVAAKSRFKIIQNTFRLFNINWYECRSFTSIKNWVNELIIKLAEEGLTDLLTTPLPDKVMDPIDIISMVRELNTQLTELEETSPELKDALDAIGRQAMASMNTSWMSTLVPVDEADNKSGLRQLFILSVVEYFQQNPLVAAAKDAETFNTQINSYQRLLEDQISIPNRLLQTDSIFRTVPQFGNQYWQNLYQLALTLLRRFRESLSTSQSLLTDVKNDLRNPD